MKEDRIDFDILIWFVDCFFGWLIFEDKYIDSDIDLFLFLFFVSLVVFGFKSDFLILRLLVLF